MSEELTTDGSTKRRRSTTRNGPLIGDKIHSQEKVAIGAFELWCLGITIVIGGQYFGWNIALSAGFGGCLLATVLTGLAYICLVSSAAEMTAALPFAGGAWAFARVTIGFYAGFLIGVSEWLEYVFYVSTTTIVIGTMCTEVSIENISSLCTQCNTPVSSPSSLIVYHL
jgi:amino acid transporter